MFPLAGVGVAVVPPVYAVDPAPAVLVAEVDPQAVRISSDDPIHKLEINKRIKTLFPKKLSYLE
jgi:hypothetical protein